jgi:hypothetical protein
MAGVGRSERRRECEVLVQEMLDEFAALGYDEVVGRLVGAELSEYREVTAPSGRIHTLLAEAWWEDEQARTVHLSVMGNPGQGLGLTSSGAWVCLEPPEQS